MSIFRECNRMSPVKQDFIWMAEYKNGEYLSEFGLDDSKENSFYDIDKGRICRFGLIGQGMSFLFESDGIFNLHGRCIDILYRTPDGKEYPLTGHGGDLYNDIITYKDAELTFNPGTSGSKPHTIVQYNMGYKAEVKFEGVKFNFKPIIKIPMTGNRPVYLNLWLVANKKMDGELILRVNNRESKVIPAPLKRGAGGEVNWVVG